MSEFKVQQTEYFNGLLKELRKRYRKIDKDVDSFLANITELKDLGASLGNNLYKARIKNSDAVRGKSGGYRLITYLQLKDNTLTLIYIYSKSDISNVSEKQLDEIVLKSFRQR
jgi:mRNA-degrading endonuclease RelE of RelBE toxin-antitoxin system